MSEKVVPSPAMLDFTSTCRQLDLSVYIPSRLLAGDKLIGRSISMTTLETMGEEKEKKEEGRGARRSCDSRTTRAGGGAPTFLIGQLSETLGQPRGSFVEP